MVRWNSSPHPISDIRDWSEAGRLELRPDFQRKAVWSDVAKIMLMDTILKKIPMPKVFVAKTIKNKHTHRIVIDGQQRITSILEFINDEFALEEPFEGPEKGRKFSELEDDTREYFLSYVIDFNEALNPTDEEVREVYSRVNKYTVPLNRQELRRADFPGDFLKVSEELAVHEYLDNAKIFSPANRRRYADVEYISEILVAMLGGFQDKKNELDNYYKNLSRWESKSKELTISEFNLVLNSLEKIFGGKFPITQTRFRQKSDFYSIFVAVLDLTRAKLSIENKDLSDLQEDIWFLDYSIRPDSSLSICSEYAIRCVSQANSASSRRWRHNFLKAFLIGTFAPELPPSKETIEVFYRIMDEPSDSLCPEPEHYCPICEEEIKDLEDSLLGWQKTDYKQLSNSSWIHSHCIDDGMDWVTIKRPLNEKHIF